MTNKDDALIEAMARAYGEENPFLTNADHYPALRAALAALAALAVDITQRLASSSREFKPGDMVTRANDDATYELLAIRKRFAFLWDEKSNVLLSETIDRLFFAQG